MNRVIERPAGIFGSRASLEPSALQKNVEQLMPAAQGFYKELLDHIDQGIYFVDRDRTILYWNQGAARLTGYTSHEVVGRRCQDDLLCHIDGAAKNLCHDGCPLSAAIREGKGQEAQVFLRHKEGRRVPVSVTVQPLFGQDGSIWGGVELFSDATAQAETRRRMHELEQMAFLDQLTGLPNRRFLEIALQTALREFQIHRHPFGVLSIDLDRFKEINDSYGHSAGDLVLRESARTLRSAFRSTDIVGRWGGDEFIGIVHSATNDLLKSLAERCTNLVSKVAVPIGDARRLRPATSVGVALAHLEDDIEMILRSADEQLYHRKRERFRSPANQSR